jgi:hypothetical protein
VPLHHRAGHPEPGQQEGGGQPGGAGPDDQHVPGRLRTVQLHRSHLRFDPASAGGPLQRRTGPFAESPHRSTGFRLVDCENLDRVRERGARVAAAEIRPLMDPSGMEM